MEHLNPSGIRTLLDSQEGRQRLALLQRSSSDTLQQASQAARSGDYDRVRTLLKPVMEGSDGETLARKLAQQLG